MSKTMGCSFCKAECNKRFILCQTCWAGLAAERKDVIRRATYRRDEAGKKFLTDLLTMDLNVVKQLIAEGNGKVLEPTSKFNKGGKAQGTFTEVSE